ncbi:MAG: uracil-DNA glycosylase [Sedimentisphaerales bacterium]|nr:uracil-DNA glycosylase [Sedimentisphaerales bacterium]
MDEAIDIKKAIQQHAEMERFFTGDFTLRAPEATVSAYEGSMDTNQECDPKKELADIARQVSVCTLCEELARTRKHTVPGEGDPQARLVFVGEAPGADEDARGRPFVGRAGQLLTKIILAMGLKREDVFICNTLKCRPPGNRDPKPDEKRNCGPFLQRQLEAIRPEIIVALGSHAAKSLLEVDLPIGRIRGRFHEYYFSPDLPPVKLMPTYHPAYLLRNYSQDNRRRVWDDMQKVMSELGLEAPKGKQA